MEDNDSDNYLLGNANRRLLFSSQLSQGTDTSQRVNALINENSIDKSLDIRLLSQMDFLTPALTEEVPSQIFESAKDSTDISGIFGETPQKKHSSGARSFFKRKIGYDAQQSEVKKSCLFNGERLPVATLPSPNNNPYLNLPDDVLAILQKLLQKPDFMVLDESRITRYQRDFKELQMLGKGISSTVTLCKHRIDGCYYAVKQISVDSQRRSPALKRAKKEVMLLSTLNDIPNVIRYFASWQEDDFFYIQLEYGFYGSVTKYTEHKSLTEEDVSVLLWQIGNALKCLHQRGFAHLDVKPDNILVCKRRELHADKMDWVFKLTDFGLTSRVADESFGDGDCRYLPPEMITSATAQKADVFALGVSAIQLLCARKVTEGKDFFVNLRTGKIPSECRVSPYLRVLLQNMITVSESARFSMDQVINHRYFDVFRKKQFSLSCNN